MTSDEATPTDQIEAAEEGSWFYTINYGPEGEANYANVHNAEHEFVGNLRLHHARQIVGGMNTRAGYMARQSEADRCAHCVAIDGPYPPGNERFWLARKLMDSKLTDAEVFGIVAYHPDIKDARQSAEEAGIKRLSELSEAAAQGEWTVNFRFGQKTTIIGRQRFPIADTGTAPHGQANTRREEANAAFIVAAVNYVRAIKGEAK